MDWRAIDQMAENRFRVEFEKAKKWVREQPKFKNLPPHKKSEIARKLAKRAVDKWLEQEYSVDWDTVKAKIVAEETDVSLEDLAV
jgi:hypothetical protein